MNKSKIAPIQLMNPYHPKWNEFCDRLTGRDGCDFIKNKKEQMIWDGVRWPDPLFIMEILKTIPEIDYTRSLKYFELYLIINSFRI